MRSEISGSHAQRLSSSGRSGSSGIDFQDSGTWLAAFRALAEAAHQVPESERDFQSGW